MDPPVRRRRARFSLPSEGRSGFDRALRWIVLAVIVAIGIAVAPRLPDAWRWITGKPAKFHPEHSVALDRVDLHALHGQRIGRWLAAASSASPGSDDPDLAKAREELRATIASDANLVALFDELDAIVTSEKLRGETHRDRALWLVYAWNDYLDTNDQPYFMHASVILRPRPMFYAHTYRVVADASGTIGEEPARVRVVSRLDRLNLRENYLGYASNDTEGAIVLADRVAELALDRVWPLLGTHASGDRIAQAFAASIAAEAQRALPGDAMALLTRTADVRAAAVAATDAMEERSECSRLWFPVLPWAGYGDEDLTGLERFVGGGPCAGVHPSELEALRAASEALRKEPELEVALEHLAAWVARPVAVHELRHVADEAERDDDDDARDCGICTSMDPDIVRAETSAYLAEIAWSDAPATSLYQICVTTEDDEEADTVHGRAREIVLAGLGWSCKDGVPADLASTARALEQEAFGRSDAIALSPELPTRLSIVSARDQTPES